MKVNNWLNFIQSIPFPSHCLLCGIPLGPDRGFCTACRAELPRNRQACPVCALPLSGAEGLACGLCTRKPPPFTGSFAPLLYRPPVSRLIGDFKFRHKLHLAAPLGRLFCEELTQNRTLPDLIVPMPLHPQRLRERGFNQALELARRLAAELDLKIDRRCCRRVRATSPQTGLDEVTRRRNMRGAFLADKGVRGRHIALFDDVITTGATAIAASRALLRAGAGRVDVWALARTPTPLT